MFGPPFEGAGLRHRLVHVLGLDLRGREAPGACGEPGLRGVLPCRNDEHRRVRESELLRLRRRRHAGAEQGVAGGAERVGRALPSYLRNDNAPPPIPRSSKALWARTFRRKRSAKPLPEQRPPPRLLPQKAHRSVRGARALRRYGLRPLRRSRRSLRRARTLSARQRAVRRRSEDTV